MDKNAIKKYAVWARRELIERVSQKALQYGITADGTADPNANSINGRLLTDTEQKQRQALIQKVNEQGYEQTMEEVAYTWFNRFAALRFMEVNGYLPSHVRVFTNDEDEFKPQILSEAIHLDLDGLNMDKVYELKNANKEEELFKYLLIVQCNALSAILPKMFQRIVDYTELLLPDYLLREGSAIQQMIELIPKEDWTDQVQIIGWLYQYYNTEPKDKVFADLKKNIKITKENIPAATQLFTPDWIVRYMVENSLGRLWLEGHTNDELKSEWKYYLDEAEQEPDVQKQLDEIRKEYAALKPEEIRCIDPCMGSGHILCYMFDVLVKIYEDYGYTAREAAGNIAEKNLWGLDIDERAAQLSYFAVMMKARQYDRRFFSRGIQPHVYAIEESNGITSAPMHDMGIDLSQEEYGEAVKQAMRLVEEMQDAKEYGSIINVTPCDWELLRRFAIPRGTSEGQLHMDIHGEIEASARLQELINVGEALAQKYHVAVTNPPYMGAGGMHAPLVKYVKEYYPDSKSDLFAVFIERLNAMVSLNGIQAMITQHAWMFLSSFEKLRLKILNTDIINMAHLGARAFEEIGGEVVQTAAFVLRKSFCRGYKGIYCRLTEAVTQNGKECLFLSGGNRYVSSPSNFSIISGSPVAYWVSPKMFASFKKGKRLKELGRVTLGMRTGDNERFLRLWHEVPYTKFYGGATSKDEAKKSGAKWFPYNKGGEYRKWYGNTESVVNWQNDGKEIKDNTRRVYPQLGDNLSWKITSEDKYFTPGVAWSRISSTNFGVRLCQSNLIFDTNAPMFFPDDEKWLLYIAGFMCTKISGDILQVLNPTLTFQVVDVGNLPVIEEQKIKENVEQIVKNAFEISKEEWDSFETSWDFLRHPLVRPYSKDPEDRTVANSSGDVHIMSPIEDAYNQWMFECDDRFDQLKSNEEELNRIFIDIYGLQDELTPEVEGKDVTVRKADLQRDIRGFISYAVGCMFGRYSLDVSGLAYAGGEWYASKYVTFQPDKDAIIPICDDEYFDDDIVGRLVKFVEVVYGKESLEENLRFIADALGGKGTSREVIRNYFINDFYKDHCKTYQKRPIYWLFDSGKKNGFKCLVYMHRYQPDTIARIRTDYVHEQQSRYRTAITDLSNRINGAGTSERVKLNKQLSKIQAQADELRVYEEKIHHLADQMISIDLDDGVKHNYALFQDVLAKIK